MTDSPEMPQDTESASPSPSTADPTTASPPPSTADPNVRRSRMKVGLVGLAALTVVLVEAAWVVLLIELTIWLVRTLA